MAVQALTEIELNPGQARKALWEMARLAKELARQPGFRGLRVFQSQRSQPTLLALSEWEGWSALAAGEAAPAVSLRLKALRASCRQWCERRLEPLFRLELPRRLPSAGLAQGLQMAAGGSPEVTAQQKRLALNALSLPGTIGVLGGRCTQDGRFFFFAVDFEAEAACQEFLGTAVWQQWTQTGDSTVWRKNARLEVRGAAMTRDPRPTRQRSEELGSLSVHIQSSANGALVLLRLRGVLDEVAVERFERVLEAVIAGGCRELTLDVSDLRTVSPTGLKALLAAARQLKAAHGQFTLIDHQGRYEQILRGWQLNQALAGPASRTRRPVRLPSPGKA
jgi:anti-anti-sigma factor